MRLALLLLFSLLLEISWAQNTGAVKTNTTTFDYGVVDLHYFPGTTTIVLQDEDDGFWVSLNEGGIWKRITLEEEGSYLVPNPYFTNQAIIVGTDKKHWRSTNSGQTFDKFTTPLTMSAVSLSFHPDQADYLIVHLEDCQTGSDCFTSAYYSKNGGRSWSVLKEDVDSCFWGRTKEFRAVQVNTVFCIAYESEVYQLLSSDDFFLTSTVLFTEYVYGMAFSGKFLLVATQNLENHCPQSMDCGSLHTSLDGKNFQLVDLPPSVAAAQHGYALLPSLTQSVFMEITTNIDYKWGTLVASDSDGSAFVRILDYVSHYSRSLLDFKRIDGVPGTIIANQVSNPDQAKLGKPKELKSKISYDDGSSWKLLEPPAGSTCNHAADCSLHLHRRAERHLEGFKFSASSAVGLVMGVGNIGATLQSYENGNTYLTRDGGRTWKNVRNGPHLYEFGDHGSLVVIVNDKDPTQHIRYSWDEGNTWTQYDFSDKKIRVSGLTTQPDSISQAFLLYGQEEKDTTSEEDPKYVLIRIDFSDLHVRQCAANDFEAWTPSSDETTGCLLGSKSTYYRRKENATCFIGTDPAKPEVTVSHCQCTNRDYECDFGYTRVEIEEECVLDGPAPTQPPNCVTGSTYNVSSGLRNWDRPCPSQQQGQILQQHLSAIICHV